MTTRSVIQGVRGLGLLASVPLALGVAACGGAAGRAVRPNDPTASDALGIPSVADCSSAPRYAKPLIVDLPADARSDVEAAMKKGVVVVSYDCKSVRVLSGCRLPDASYEYAGVSRKEQVVQIKDMDEMSVNLPLLSAKLGAEVKSGKSIDLALVLVGRRSTTVAAIDPQDLDGGAGCEGATHFVQTASVGAFSIATGTVGKVAAIGAIFGAGASATSSSEAQSDKKDGSLDACRSSDPDATDPPKECRTPVRLELLPIAAKAEGAAATKKTKSTRKKSNDAPADRPDACPPGYESSDGICARAKRSDDADYKAQCEGGSGDACVRYATSLVKRAGGDEGWNAARPFFKQACDDNSGDGCVKYGMSLEPDLSSPNVASQSRAQLKAYDKACLLGEAYGCTFAGYLLSDDDYKIADKKLAAYAFGRGCALGLGSACSSRAEMLLKGDGIAQDTKAGVELLARSCRSGMAGSADNCGDLATIYATGQYGVAKDASAAYAWFKRACRQSAVMCDDAAKSALALGKDAEGFALAKRSCDETWECALLGDLHDQGRGTAKDPSKAREVWTAACKNGEGDDESCKRMNARAPRRRSRP